ncbi:MAG: hypothetical protein QW735_01835 [archaeon]
MESILKSISYILSPKANEILLLVAVIFALVSGCVLGFLFELQDFLAFPLDVWPVLISLACFAFGFTFFGYGATIASIFIGIQLGTMFKISTFSSTFLLSLSCFLMLYASIRLGQALYDDLEERGNFKVAFSGFKILFILALLLALIVQFFTI